MKKLLSKIKNDRAGGIIITIFWTIFLVATIISTIIHSKISLNNTNKNQGYQETTLVFDHIDDDMVVYKYEVDGETYTYKEQLSNESTPKKGDKYKSYYNVDEPSDLRKPEKINSNYTSYALIVFFTVCIIISIVDIILEGTHFSMLLLCVPFLVAECVVLISLYSGSSLAQLKSSMSQYIFPTILMTCFFGGLLFGTVWAMVAILKESIQTIQRK